MSSWRAALRIACREARRAKGRSALALAMIAVPVLAMSFAAASFDMLRLTPAERAERALGAADAQLWWRFAGPAEQGPNGEAGGRSAPRTAPYAAADLLALLPAGSRIIPHDEGLVELRTATGISSFPARTVAADDPLARGLVTLTAGRAPTAGAEVAVTRAAGRRLGAQLGDQVRSARDPTTWTVVGIVEFPDQLGESVLFPPRAMPSGAVPPEGRGWLADTPEPVSWAQVRQLNRHGVIADSRAVRLDPPSPEQIPEAFRYSAASGAQDLGLAALVVGLAVLEIVLLAGPAFAVGARRRQRDLALVAANGGTPAHLRRIVLADGLVIGVVGAVAGVLLGVALAFAARPLVEQYVAGARAGGYRVHPWALLGIAALAAVTGVLAALVPAWTAARQDVVGALTGRRPVVRARRRWLVVGLLLAATGAAITLYGAGSVSVNLVLTGLVLGELGLVLCTPTLVGLIARLGRLLPLTPRIALRDTARNRAAAAPAISAVLAAVAGSVALGVYISSERAQWGARHQAALPPGYVQIDYPDAPGWSPDTPVLDRVAAVVRDTLPTRRVTPVQRLRCPADMEPFTCQAVLVLPAERDCPQARLTRPLTADQQRAARRDPRCATPHGYWDAQAYGEWVGDADAVATLTGAHPADLTAARAVLDAGGVVLSDPRFVVDGRATLRIFDRPASGGPAGAAFSELTVPAHVLTSGVPLIGPVLSPGSVAQSRLTLRPGGIIVATAAAPSRTEEDRLVAGLREIHPHLATMVERGPPGGADPTVVVLAVAAGLITLGAAGIATGLAAAEGRADLATLAAVGASPRVRRLLSLSQAGTIAGLGSLLGVTAGLGAAFAVLTVLNRAGADRWPTSPPYPLSVPWTSLLVVLVVPVIAMLGAGLLTRSRLPAERRRPD